MNCPVCNNQLKENDVFCKNCGTPLTLEQRAFSTYKENAVTKPLKTPDFILLFLLKCIPIVNIIVFIVWAVSATNLNRKSYARATIIWAVVETLIIMSVAFILSPYYIKYLPMF